MNCKPNDMAVVVRAGKKPEWLGRVVTVIRRFDAESWITDPLPEGFVAVMDRVLRPIRDQDGDESFIRKVSVDDQINVLRKINQRKKVGA
jgi:hypothetical protein